MLDREKQAVIETAKELERLGLVRLGGGSVSVRADTGELIMTPACRSFNSLRTDGLLVMDSAGGTAGGVQPPDCAGALRYIYAHMPEVNAVIYTHQPYATAVGLAGEEFPACCTTQCNVCLGSVSVAPCPTADGEDMGVQAVRYIGERRAVIIRQRGVIAVGPGLHEALAACVYMEDAAKCYLSARSAASGKAALMTPEQEAEAVETFKDYGQKRT